MTDTVATATEVAKSAADELREATLDVCHRLTKLVMHTIRAGKEKEMIEVVRAMGDSLEEYEEVCTPILPHAVRMPILPCPPFTPRDADFDGDVLNLYAASSAEETP